jgi:predicted CoA-binding protein
MTHLNPTDDALRTILTTAQTVAVVGASSKQDRPSHHIMKTLIDAGYRVIPVTPHEPSVLGRTAYPSLADIPERIDIVDVFRRAEETPAIADEAVAIGAKVLWLQLGISSDEAARRAGDAGLTVVMDTCIGQTVHRLGVKAAPSAGIDDVAEADEESFPASDPPSWSPLRPGAPDRHDPL